ncbi:hypothetical protein UPYG_G00096680 [Umbra pygmaea]|uniref:NACHT, LRR and PYD domains-containing protein 12-like n=1 Tax=Umbra pygmaea TaxID=75934 RepID=A0ABD0XPT7_UMBPY
MSLSGGRDEQDRRKRRKRTASKMSLSGGREEEERTTASKMSLSGGREEEEGTTASKMSLSGGREEEEGNTASKMSLSGGRDEENEISHQDRPDSPVPSCHQDRPVSNVTSCISMKSDRSIIEPGTFKNINTGGQLEIVDIQSYQTYLDSIFQSLEEKCVSFLKKELKRFKRILSPKLPEKKEAVNTEDEKPESSASEGALKITLHILRNMNHKDIADTLQQSLVDDPAMKTQFKLKAQLCKKFECVYEGIPKQGNPTLLKNIYTELYITEGGSGEVNNEHEMRWIETSTRKQARPETAIKCNDIFKPLPGQDKPIRTVLTKGIAGIGKTVSVQKFLLDWAEGKANQDIQFIFPLSFRELNFMKTKHSLMELLHHFYIEIKESGISNFNEYKVLFVFDGLDECRLPLDLNNYETCCDVTESLSIDVLLINLINRNLLPSALIWITSRPAAANQIPPEYVDQVTEVKGFNELQKELYFKKRFGDVNLANRIISHIKTSRSLHIMCHIPVFCWISASVLEHMLNTDRGEMPKNLTQLYIGLVVFQIRKMDVKYHKEDEPHWNKKIIKALGKLAFQQLQKGHLIFYDEDLKECGIDVNDASVYSGVCTQIFKLDYGPFQNKMYCFVHLSIQEFLAALYVFLTFINDNKNVMDEPQSGSLTVFSDKHPEVIFLQSAIDQALLSENGHLDLFLRFLLGLTLESNQALLRDLMTQSRNSSQTTKETVAYIKEKIRENSYSEKIINLFHCLNELNDRSLVEEIQTYLNSGSVSKAKLSPTQWSALVFVLLTSDDELDVFDQKKYSRSDEGLLRLLPVIKVSRTALLNECNLTETGCEALASALSSHSSHLRELDLSNNDLKDAGVMKISDGLKDPQCKLETLRLRGCGVKEEGVDSLATALLLNSSHLSELDVELDVFDLKKYSPSEEGLLKLLPMVKASRKALLNRCNLTERCCKELALVLNSDSSHLKELDLSDNDLKDSGVKLISDALKGTYCQLEKIKLNQCRLTKPCCEALASALSSPSSHLRALDLSNNDLKDAGVKLLSTGLEDKQCKLETLRMSGCLVTEKGCASLVSALRLNPSHLKELDLSYNHPGDSGVTLLSAGLEDPTWRLEKLNVDHNKKNCLMSGLKKYACELTLDPNTTHRKLSLSEGKRTVTSGEEQLYPDHPERFDYWYQVLCREGLTKRCYWEVEWSDEGTHVSVTYKGINRKGEKKNGCLGRNDKSWSLFCNGSNYSAWHNNKRTDIPITSSGSNRVAVYLDWPAGILSFYRVSSDTLTHLYTFNTTFTEPLYPGFKVYLDSSVSVACKLAVCIQHS